MKHAVQDWMTKHPLKISPKEMAKTAYNIMKQEDINHLVVYDEDQLVGVISARDAETYENLKRRLGNGCDAPIHVADLMSRIPVTISGQTRMTEAIKTMDERGIHALVITNGSGGPQGILTSTDVMRYALVASKYADISEGLQTQIGAVSP